MFDWLLSELGYTKNKINQDVILEKLKEYDNSQKNKIDRLEEHLGQSIIEIKSETKSLKQDVSIFNDFYDIFSLQVFQQLEDMKNEIKKTKTTTKKKKATKTTEKKK